MRMFIGAPDGSDRRAGIGGQGSQAAEHVHAHRDVITPYGYVITTLHRHPVGKCRGEIGSCNGSCTVASMDANMRMGVCRQAVLVTKDFCQLTGGATLRAVYFAGLRGQLIKARVAMPHHVNSVRVRNVFLER